MPERDRNDPGPLILGVDSVQIPVPDLEAGLDFYRGALGQPLIWRTASAAGLRLLRDGPELVLQTERPRPEVDLLVDSVDQAVERFVEAGGSVRLAPFEIPVGRAAVVADPWGNAIVLVDLSQGVYETDAAGNVLGVTRQEDR